MLPLPRLKYDSKVKWAILQPLWDEKELTRKTSQSEHNVLWSALMCLYDQIKAEEVEAEAKAQIKYI